MQYLVVLNIILWIAYSD